MIKNEELHLERNFFILFFVFFFIIFIPGLSDRIKLYAGIFVFGLMIGEIVTAMFFGFQDVIRQIRNVFNSPYKGHGLLKLVVLIFFILVAAFFIYLIYLYTKYAAILLSPVTIPWWFILVGFAADLSIYILKKKIEKSKI